MEPNVRAIQAVYSRNTGIIDSHGLMKHFQTQANKQGATLAYKNEVVGVQNQANGYRVTVADDDTGFTFFTRVLINAAGLHCHEIAAMAGIDIRKAGYQLHYCKGEYFSLAGHMASRLVYPVPEVVGGPLGVHVTLDLDGRTRLGPNSRYIDEIDYKVDESKNEAFYNAVLKILPGVRLEDLAPDMAGVRPRLQGPGDAARDFVIQDETEKGLKGMINLIGIESPGLTASPAIARYVSEIVRTVI
jgi:L-2-hydroxyglutarate oxidase LhgO